MSRAVCHHALSVDVEEWFQVENFAGIIAKASWQACEARAAQSCLRLLDLFDRYACRATFFILGWVAERAPDLVVEIAQRGHEIGLHGYGHERLNGMTREDFQEDLDRALEILSPLSPAPIRGYRAPSFSLHRRMEWAFDVLLSRGFAYDSSSCPGRSRARGGGEGESLDIHRLPNGLLEVPLAAVEIGSFRFPCGGGGFFRLFPYCVTRVLLRRCASQGRSVVFYLHPWEIDPDQPRVAAPFLSALRHRINLDRTQERLEQLLSEFSFVSIRELLHERGY